MNKFVFIFILVISPVYLVCAEINLGNKFVFINNSSTITNNYLFYSYCNDAIFGFKSNGFDVKLYKKDNVFLKSTFVGVELIDPVNIYEPLASDSGLISETYIDDADTVVEIEDRIQYNNLHFPNIYDSLDIYYSIYNNRIRINIEAANVLELYHLKYKFFDTDSLRLTADSNLIVYTKLGEFEIERLKYRYINEIDSVTFDTLNYNSNFIINTDTLSLFFSNLDSTKVFSTFYEDSLYQSNPYVSTNISEMQDEDNNKLIASDMFKNTYVMQEKYRRYYYYLNNYYDTLKTDSLKYFITYDILKYNKYDFFERSNTLFYFSDTNKLIYLSKLSFNPNNYLVLIGSTKKELKGDFKQKLEMDTLSNQFTDNYYNGFISNINSRCKVKYTNYIYFDGNNSNVYLKDYKFIYKKQFLIGIADSIINIDSTTAMLKYNQSSVYKSFIIDYKENEHFPNYTMFISSGSNSEYVALESLDNTIDNTTGQIKLLISGTTNANSLLADSLWQKNGLYNDNFVLYTGYFLDTISKVINFDGNGNDGYYNSMSDYHLNQSYVFNNDLSGITFIGNTNSATFSLENDSTIKYNKVGSNYNVFSAMFDSTNILRSLSFIKSNEDQFLINAKNTEIGNMILIKSLSNDFELPEKRDTLISDTLSGNVTNNKSIIVILDPYNSLYKDTSNVTKYNPYWVSYFENDSLKFNLSYMLYKDNNLYLTGNTNINVDSFFLRKSQKVNGNNSNVISDALYSRIYLGVLNIE